MDGPLPIQILISSSDPGFHEHFWSVFRRGAALENAPNFEISSVYKEHTASTHAERAHAAGRPVAIVFFDCPLVPGARDLGVLERLLALPDLQVVLCVAHPDSAWPTVESRLGHSNRVLILRKPLRSVEIEQTARVLAASLRLGPAAAPRPAPQSSAGQVDKLEALSRLAGCVGHEINNPLAYVMANLEWLREELPPLASGGKDGLGEEINQVLGEIHHGFDRIRRTVAGLSIFTQIENELPSKIDVNQVLRQSIHAMAAELGLKARLVSDFRGRPLVLTTAGSLDRVFVNILRNAVLAIPVGEPEAHTVTVTSQWKPGDGEAVVEIQDTGSGIAPEHLDRVFEPFFTTRPLNTAVGLGLSHCHNIVSAIGGRITVDSPGVSGGTSVRVELPVIPQQSSSVAVARAVVHMPLPQSTSGTGSRPVLRASTATATTIVGGCAGAARAPVRAPALKESLIHVPGAGPAVLASPLSTARSHGAPTGKVRGRIEQQTERRVKALVVDDEPLVLRAFQRLLMRHQVFIASGGRSALELCREQEFDIIFCDLALTDLSGIDVHEQLQSESPRQAEKMIFITAGTQSEQATRFLRQGNRVTLQKPVSRAELQAAMERIPSL